MKFALQFSAQLENIQTVQPRDTTEDPFEYTFKVSCVRCREVHPKEIIVSRAQISDSYQKQTSKRGEASNFSMKCSFCRNDGNILILTSPYIYSQEDSLTVKTVIELDSRGLTIESFVPNGYFTAKSGISNQQYDEVELDDEWYDVDEKTFEQVSITDINWSIKQL